MNTWDGGRLAETLQQLQAHQRSQPLPPWSVRRQKLQALERLVRANQDAFAAAIHADFGCRPAEETALLEVFPSLAGIRHALRHGRRWMRPRRRRTGRWFLPGRSRLLPQPAGVVGIVVPWNYPLYLAIGPLTDALAAGNRVMLKLSEHTPRLADVLADALRHHFPDGSVTAVTGGPGVAQAFTALPFDHLLFTGSTAVGREVMAGAAAALTPLTLELGGKSPALIGPGARLDHAVRRILRGKLVNAGQTCIAPDHVLLPGQWLEAFVETARRTVAESYPDLAASGQYASLAGEGRYRRMLALRDQAVAAGACAHALAEGDPGRNIFPPTLLTGVRPDMAVMQEEVFGPLLPLVSFDHLDAAVEFLATRPAPLALYLFEDDAATAARVLDRVRAGGVTINDTLLHIAQPDLPFGGRGASGFGAWHGQAGFDTFSRLLPVFRQARWNLAGLLDAPYGARFRRLLGWLLSRP